MPVVYDIEKDPVYQKGIERGITKGLKIGIKKGSLIGNIQAARELLIEAVET